MTGKSSHGTLRRTSREEPTGGGGLRFIPALFGIVVLISLIAVGFVLRKLRDEHMNLRAAVVRDLKTAAHPEEDAVAALRSQLGALEGKIRQAEEAGSQDGSRRDVQSDVILRALAVLLHQHEVGPSEISAILGDLPEADRLRLMEELKGKGPEAGHAGLWHRVDEIDVPAPVEATEPEPAPVTEPEPEPAPVTEPAPAHGSELLQEAGEGGLGNSGEYTVQPADTLTKLSRVYKVSLSALVRENDIPNPDLILIGQVLKIPPGE